MVRHKSKDVSDAEAPVVLVTVALDRTLADELDAWIAARSSPIDRSEAIRAMVAATLDVMTRDGPRRKGEP
jgi:metal-responsive CopG/Arc/MetJ family transcriptional regulator